MTNPGVSVTGFSASAIDALSAENLRQHGGFKWRVPPAGDIGAFIAEMDFGTAPAVSAAVRGAVDGAEWGYLAPDVAAEHGAACAAWQAQYYGWEVNPDNVHALGDVLAVMRIAIEKFSAADSAIILPTPAYMPFFAVPPEYGRRIIEVPSIQAADGSYQLDIAGIDAAFAAGGGLLVLCNPHNPTGQVAARSELEAVAAVVERHSGRVFADEVHAPLRHPDAAPHIPYASISDAAARHTLTGTSMSKAFNIPGLKCAAAIVSNEADVEVWSGFHLVVTHGAATPGVVANTAAYRDGAPWLAKVNDYLAGNRQVLTDLVAEKLPGVRFHPPDATYLAWLDFRALKLPTPPGEFLREKAGVWTNEGADFGAPGAGFVRLNMATPRPILAEIVERIAAALP